MDEDTEFLSEVIEPISPDQRFNTHDTVCLPLLELVPSKSNSAIPG